MKYSVLFVNDEAMDFKSNNNYNVDLIDGKIPITIKDINAKSSKVTIQETMKYKDFLKLKKFSDEEIEDMAKTAVETMLPEASTEKQEEAKNKYFNKIVKIKHEAFILQLSNNSEISPKNIIISHEKKMPKILKLLNMKENLTTTLINKMGIPIEDFLLWIYWRSLNNPKLPEILIKNIAKDITKDGLSPNRSQQEKGGNNVRNSKDLKYRIGSGYPLTSLEIKLKEEQFGINMILGITLEDGNNVFINMSSFNPNKDFQEQLNSYSDSDVQKEIYQISLSIDLLYRFIAECKKDLVTWNSIKAQFISDMERESKA